LNPEILNLADDILKIIVNMANVYDNPLRKPMANNDLDVPKVKIDLTEPAEE